MAISGNATTSDGQPVDVVRIFRWPDKELYGAVLPDAAGDWTFEPVQSGEYGITYIAAGCQPVTHGPYYLEVDNDPYYQNVVALLHFDGDFIDETGRIWYQRGSQSIISETSAYFGGSGLRVDGIDSSLDSDAQLGMVGNDRITIEGWMRIQSYTGPKMPGANIYRHTLLGQSGNGSFRDQFICIEEGFLKVERNNTYAGVNIAETSTTKVPLNEFFHIAYSYDGTTTRAFINGVKNIEFNSQNGWADTGYPLRIGANLNVRYQEYRQGSNADFDDIRITKGISRYISDFDIPTKPFQNI